MTEKIVELLTTLTGVSGQEAEFFAQAAQLELCTYLKDGILPEDCQDVFTMAAAILAAAMLRQNSAGGIKSYSAGQNSVTFSDENQSIQNAREQAKALLRQYINDDGFIFKRVKS